MTDTRVMVLHGQGINCDNETERAFENAGAKTEKVLMSQLASGKKDMEDYDILVFPGGFSHGDDIAAGKVMAVEFKYKLGEQMQGFVRGGKPVMGICNGFQIMVALGLLPGLDGDHAVRSALLANDSGRFEDRWVHLEVDPESPCVFTKGIKNLYLPVRHGEGKFYAENGILRKMEGRRQVVARYTGPDGEADPGYPWNPNGSIDDVAGICDPTGLIFGLMPHPEACTEIHHHPRWTRNQTKAEEAVYNSRRVFENAVNYVRSGL